MGYARGVRGGHAGGHLREPLIELVEALASDEPDWWPVDSGNGELFDSPQAAYAHLGRLWHSVDVVPSDVRQFACDLLAEDEESQPYTYGQLVRRLRPLIADLTA